MSRNTGTSLHAFELPCPLKLSLLWASMMFLYIYNDYFALYAPGTIEMMSAGIMGPLGEATDTIMLAVALLMAIPALMVFLSASLPPALGKWLNVVFGAAYTCVNVATVFGSPPAYQFMVSIETVLSVSIVIAAFRWPRTRLALAQAT